MSTELQEKLIQYNDLKSLKEQRGWELLTGQIQVRLVSDQVRIVSPPEELSSEGRGYLAGRIKGIVDTMNLIDVLMSGLQSEIQMLREKEDASGTDASSDDAERSDADLASASQRIDPGSG